MSETEHTPEPWYVLDHKKEGFEEPAYIIEICRAWGEEVKPATTPGYGSCYGIHILRIEHQNDNPCVPYFTARASADRIVACVNACAGIYNEALEKGLYTHDNEPWEPNSERAYTCSCGCKPTVEPNEEAFQVVCWSCGTRGPIEDEEAAAIYEWNMQVEALTTHRTIYEIIRNRVKIAKAKREAENE